MRKSGLGQVAIVVLSVAAAALMLRLTKMTASGGSVLHVRGYYVETPGGKISPPKEAWYDTATGDLRWGTSSMSETLQGTVYKRYSTDIDPPRLTVIEVPTVTHPLLWAEADGGYMLQARLRRDRGKLDVSTVITGTINGTPAYKVYDAPLYDLDVPLAWIVRWVDQAELLPLVDLMREPVTSTEWITTTWVYTTTEYIARSSLPEDFFDIQPDPGANVARRVYMTLEQAQAFELFDVYYLGESFDGLPLDLTSLELLEVDGPSYAADQPPRRDFQVYYAEPYDDPNRRKDRVSLSQSNVAEHLSLPHREDGVLLESINGRPVKLFPWNQVLTQIGDTFIEIRAKNQELLLEAVEQLRPLN